MKKAILFLAVLTSNAFAGMESDAYELWSLDKMMTTTSTIKIVRANDVNEVRAICDKESVRRGAGKFGFKIDACSFWDKTAAGDKCTIVVARKTNNDTLGHEVRHCFQGKFH